MSQQEAFTQRTDVANSKPAQDHIGVQNPNDSGGNSTVYKPRDYAASARQERDRLIAEGADPNSIILQSELRKSIPRREGDSPADFAIRYSKTMNAMIRRGDSILNDLCTADVEASQFGTNTDQDQQSA